MEGYVYMNCNNYGCYTIVILIRVINTKVLAESVVSDVK